MNTGQIKRKIRAKVKLLEYGSLQHDICGHLKGMYRVDNEGKVNDRLTGLYYLPLYEEKIKRIEEEIRRLYQLLDQGKNRENLVKEILVKQDEIGIEEYKEDKLINLHPLALHKILLFLTKSDPDEIKRFFEESNEDKG